MMLIEQNQQSLLPTINQNHFATNRSGINSASSSKHHHHHSHSHHTGKLQMHHT